MNLTSLTEHQLLVFWVQLLVLLFVARSLGGLMRRIGQPTVVGELAAGLVLGPSLLGKVWPAGFEWLFPADEAQSAMLLAVGWIGVVLLVVATGYETDLALIRSLGRGAVLVSSGSLVVPLMFGAAVGLAMPVSFVGDDATRVVFGLFMATALSISSLPVIAKIMGEMGLMRRNFGQLTLAAGMANDIAGWLLLGVIAGLAAAGEIALGPLAVTVVGMVVFMVAALTLGQRAVDAGLKALMKARTDGATRLTAAVLVALAGGVATQWLGVEAVLGAFVAGILLGRSKFEQPAVLETLETVTAGVFAPIFFATAGLRVDLAVLSAVDVAFWAVVVTAVASIAKFGGAWVGARAAGMESREGVALGAGLNARGALEIVIATVGLGLGVLNELSYTLVVIMAIATSMMAPPMLRAAVRGWSGTSEEQERLQREETLNENVIVRDKRILLPSQGGRSSLVAGQLVHLAWPQSSEVTILSIAAEDADVDVTALADLLDEREVSVERVVSPDPGAAIAKEAELGYGAIVVGAGGSPDRLVSPVVDRLLATSPVPVVIARHARNQDRPAAFTRVLVPVTGSQSSRAAQEIAFSLSNAIGTQVGLLHVVPPSREAASPLDSLRRRLQRAGEPSEAGSNVVVDVREGVAGALVADASSRADRAGARAIELVRSGPSTADEIVTAANEMEADLVVLGGTLRKAGDAVFLGDLVQQVLDQCDITVVVVALPDGYTAATVAPIPTAEHSAPTDDIDTAVSPTSPAGR